jgi:predicted RNA-binding Zn-ribbon protein involved in translation (DUF1610 family)
MKPPTAKNRIPSIHCPHCGARSLVRTSEQLTPLVRELRYRCDDDDCGHTFVAQLSVIRTIRPSAKPRPGIHLPIGNPALGCTRPRHANDDAREPANDADPASPPTDAAMSG